MENKGKLQASRGARRISGSLLLAAGALVLFGWLSQEVALGGTQAFDDWSRNTIHAHASPGLTTVMAHVTEMGSFLWLTPLTIGLTIGLVIRRRPSDARLLLISLAGGFLFDMLLKLVFHRARPEPYFGTQLPASFSYPSGHAIFSTCFYGMAAAVFSERVNRWWACWGIRISAGLIILMVCFSRVYLGVHYTSDVIGGCAISAFWVSLLILKERSRLSVAQRG
jgi:membrane-associated phospholipid phosphatase